MKRKSKIGIFGFFAASLCALSIAASPSCPPATESLRRAVDPFVATGGISTFAEQKTVSERASVELGAGFGKAFFVPNGGKALALLPQNGWPQHQVVAVNKRLSGNYSVSFALTTTLSAFLDLYVYFGADSPDVFNSSSKNAIAHSANGFHVAEAGGGGTLYAADGTTVEEGNGFLSAFGRSVTDRKILVRFEKTSARTVEIYYDAADSASAAITKRNVAIFDKDIPDGGYLCFAPIRHDSLSSLPIYIDDLVVKNETGVLYENDFDEGSTSGLTINGASMKIDTPCVIDHSSSAKVTSNFEFVADGSEYFEASFDYNVSSDSPAVFAFGNNELVLTNETVALNVEGDKKDEIQTKNGRISLKTQGTDGLNLKIETSDGTIEKNYAGVDASGKIEIYPSAVATGGSSFYDMKLAGNVTNPPLGVKINRFLLKNASVGRSVAPQSDVDKIFGGGKADRIVYTITSGPATLDGDKIEFTAEGEVTLRAYPEGYPTITDEVTFEVTEADFVNYSLIDDFDGVNEGNWTKFDPKNVLTVNGNVTFYNDRASEAEDYEGAKLVSNVKFESGGDVVFDLSFSPYITNMYKGSSDPEEVQKGLDCIRLNSRMSTGILLGMKKQSAGVNEAIYFRLNPPYAALYVGGEKVAPVVSNGENFMSYMDHDDPNSMRLVAKSDGKLYVYIGNRYFNESEPFAVYDGLDLDGYVAFTTNAYNTERVDLPISFKNIALGGNVRRDMDDFSVLGVKLDVSNLINAVVSDRPIPLSCTVTTRPNLVDYHDVRYSVSGGGAKVEGNMLTVTSGEPFTVRVTSRYDAAKYDEYIVNPKVLVISKISIRADELQNLNVFSQPVRLSAVVSSNYSYIREFNEVTYTVVSGNAEVFSYYSVTSDATLWQLRVTGAGEVVLRATSTIDKNSYDEITFTVTDPYADKGTGCSAASAVQIIGALAACSFLLLKKRG